MKSFKPKIKQVFAIVLSSAMLLSNVNVYAVDSVILKEKNYDEEDAETSIIEETEMESIDSTESIYEETESIDSTEIDESSSTESKETTDNTIISTNSLDEFSNEVAALVSEDVENDNTYATKRLIVLSNVSDFDTHNAVSTISYDNLYVLSYDTEKDCKKAYKALSGDSTITSVEIDTFMEAEGNNTLDSTSASSNETELKKYLDAITPSKEVKVAILDTGIDTSKFDSNRIIDLGINLSSSGEENSILDDNGHGTDMAAIISNNSNEFVKLMPIKVANSDGKATVLNTYLGIQKAMEYGADIINISMNTYKSATSQVLTDIINEASNKGILVVVSAGNNNIDTANITPANIDSAIVVSAVNDDNSFAGYSNYGSAVDYCSYGTYGDKTGTSYSTANVTGIFANMLSKEQDTSIIDQYAIDLGDEGKDSYFGNGFVGFKQTISNKNSNTVTDESSEEPTINSSEDDGMDGEAHIMTKEECENDEFYQKYHKETKVENVLDYDTDDTLNISAVETLTINPNGGSATHIDGTSITSSQAKSLGSLIAIGETKSFSTSTQKTDIDGTYHFVVVGGAGGYAELLNSNGTSNKKAAGGNGVKITSNSVSISKGTSIDFKDGATSKDVSKKILSVYSGADAANHIAGAGTDVYKLNGSSYNTHDWYQAIFGDGGNSSSVSFSKHKIVAAGGGGGAVLYYYIDGLPNKWTGKKALAGKSVPLNTNDNTSNKSYYDFEKAYKDKYGGTFVAGSGLWDSSSQYSAGKGYKNGKYGGYGSNAIAGGSCGQNYVNGFTATYAAYTANKSYVQMVCDSKSFTIKDPKRTGYTFSGWTVTGNGVTQKDNGTSTTFTKSSEGNMTIKANWTINTYTVTCNDYLTDGTFLGTAGSITRNYGTSISGSDWGTSSPYNNAQYTYNYNSCTSATVTSNCTVNRYWTRNLNSYLQTVKVRYQNADGSWGAYSNVINKNYNYGSTVSWSRAADATYKAASLASYTVTSANTKYVDVYRNTHTVTLNKGTGIASVSGAGTYYHGQSVTINATLSNGYNWVNWTGSTTYSNISNTFIVDGNKTFTANAILINQSTLTINPNGGFWNGSTSTQSFTQNRDTTKSIPNPTRTGYTFAGWTKSSYFTAGSLSGTTFTFGATNGGTGTLTANWNINQYTVNYIDVVDNVNGKQLGKTTKQVNYGTSIRGSELGNNTADNTYYNGYYYVSDTSTTVGTSGAIVYRIFKQRMSTVSGNIIWEDWNNKNSSRPDSVTLHINGSDGKTHTFTIKGDNSKNTSTNTWSYNEQVPKYDSNGNVVTYTVTQDKAISKEEGLIYKDPVVNGYDITNSISANPSDVPVKPNINITTYIEWQDNNNQYGFRPTGISLDLLQNGNVIQSINTSSDSYTFTKLYKYDENGNLYKYTVSCNDVDRYNKTIDNDSGAYDKEITYTFQAPTYSVIIPKTVVLDGTNGVGNYTVSVKGTIDNRDFIKVIPDNSFTMRNAYLSPVTATVQQKITSFTNKNNIKSGVKTTGTITAKSLAGKWSGNFNFNIYFEFGK